MDLKTALESTVESQDKLGTLRMRRVEWALFYSLDGKKTLLDHAQRHRLKDDEIIQIGQFFVDQGLAIEAAISISSYLTSQGLADSSPEPIALQDYLTEAKSSPTVKSQPINDFVVVNLDLEEPRAATPAPAQIKGMDIKAVVGFILESTKNPLAVYTIFLKIPPALLKKNGVKSLPINSKSESIFVSDPDLQNSIVDAVLDKIGLTLPSYVWS